MSQRPLVSVIIPCYNQAAYVGDAIRSVLAQTMPEWECIVVNDGSTDHTRGVVSQFLCDDRVRYLEQDNRGLAGARNRGLRTARGRHIQFLDADDLLAPEKLRVQGLLLREGDNRGIAYSDYRFLRRLDIGETRGRDRFCSPRFVMTNPLWDIVLRWETELSIPVHCFLFDDALFRHGDIWFDESLPNHEDWDFWVRLFELKPVVLYSPGQLAVYRVHPDSMGADRKRMWVGFHMALRKHLRRSRHDPVMRMMLKKKLQEVSRIYREDREDALGTVARYLVRAFRRNVPWPVQRLTHRLCDVALEKFGVDLPL